MLAKFFNPKFTSYTTENLLMIQNKINEDQTKSTYKLFLSEFKNSCKRQRENACLECEESTIHKKQKNNHLSIIHLNLRGLNSNMEFANKCCMISNISFFTECMCTSQLLFENSIYAPNKKLFSKNSVKYKKKGRPTGGLLFVVDTNINAKCKFISRRTGVLTINKLAIIGTYMPSYDGRPSTEISYKKEMFMIEQEKRKLENNNFEVLIVGDLNVDVDRNVKNYKRKEVFGKFLLENVLDVQEIKFEQTLSHSYHYEFKDKNDETITIKRQSIIDYTLASAYNTNIAKAVRFASKANNSDHHPTLVEYNLIETSTKNQTFSNLKKKFFNWDDTEFIENFRNRVSIGCSNLNSRLNSLKTATDKNIANIELNKIYLDFQEIMLSSKEKAHNELYLTGRTKKRKFNGKTKRWWTDELKCVFNRIFRLKNVLKNSTNKDENEKIIKEIAASKREFRTLKRFNIKLIQDNNLRKLDDLFKQNKTSFWKKLKNLDSKKQDIEADLEQIRDEFKKIFTIRNASDKKYEEKMTKILDKFVKDTFHKIHNQKIDEKIINDYINDLSNGKSVGISNISNEMLKYGNSVELTITVTTIFEIIINFGILPNNFNTSILKPLVKDAKKSTKEASNLRPLGISDAISNMLEKLLLFFIDMVYVNHFKQFGFKKNSSCNHALFVLKTAINYAKIKNKRLYTVAIDASKAFDKVNRLYLWVKLIDFGINEAIIRAIMLYYAESTIIINLNGENSQPFKSTVGVRQGGILSPRLFAIYVHDMLDKISKLKLGLRIGKLSIDVIGYADDILLVSNIKSNLQEMLQVIDNYCNAHEIKVNGDKTVLLIFNKWCNRSKRETTEDTPEVDLSLQNIKLLENYSLKYLGVELSSDQSNTKHINTRCDKAMKAMAMIKAKGLGDKQIHALTKAQLYKSFIMPIIMYGLELLTLSKQEYNQLRITESNMIKNLLNVRSSCRTKPIMSALKIESIDRRLTKGKLSLFNRLNENKYTKLIIEECKSTKTEIDMLKEVDVETSEFSIALDLVTKCKLKCEIITHSTHEEWKNNSIANQLLEIFNLKNCDKIISSIMAITSTYVPKFLSMS